MSYMHIDNLYKDDTILMLKQCYVMEKIHGTSAHISYKADGNVVFFSGGVNHAEFAALFNPEELKAKFAEKFGAFPVTIYGEAYGGKLMKMSATYGPKLRFVAFEVKIGETWLSVPNAADVSDKMGQDFVPYALVNTDVDVLNLWRDVASEQAVKVGMGTGHPREGIVIRPIVELTTSNGKRVIAKHKAAAFGETKTEHTIGDTGKAEALANARAIADEWVTSMRLQHLQDTAQLPFVPENIGKYIPLMVEDILREAGALIIDSTDARKEIARATAGLIKRLCREELVNV